MKEILTLRGALSLLALIIIPLAALSQPASSGKDRIAISGKVLGDDGEPLSPVNVYVVARSVSSKATSRTNVDADGNFKFVNLPSGNYLVTAIAQAYIMRTSDIDGPNRFITAHTGDVLDIALMKGGVITGRVTDSVGEPVVGVFVSAGRIGDLTGRRDRLPSFELTGYTDDRGIYRISGLLEGSYRVYTRGATSQPGIGSEQPSYYPSDTIDTAQLVPVNTSVETTGIDIRHRGEPGHRISGTIAEVPGSPDLVRSNFSISALYASTGVQAGVTSGQRDSSNSFTINGLADGEYVLVVQQNGFTGNSVSRIGASEPVRITIKGSDRTGLVIKLKPLTRVSGTVEIEKLDPAVACSFGRVTPMPLNILQLASRSRGGPANPPVSASASPDEKGSFTFDGVVPGPQRLKISSLEASYFLKKISLPVGVQTSAGEKQSSRDASEKIDATLNPSLAGLRIVVAEGAGAVSGKISAEMDDELQVVLVPEEKERLSMNTSYRIAQVRDRVFNLRNVPPGKYRIFTKRLANDAAIDNDLVPDLDSEARQTLRSEAETKGKQIEIGVCQKLVEVIIPAPQK